MTLVIATSMGVTVTLTDVAVKSVMMTCQYLKCGQEFETTNLHQRFCRNSHRASQANLEKPLPYTNVERNIFLYT